MEERQGFLFGEPRSSTGTTKLLPLRRDNLQETIKPRRYADTDPTTGCVRVGAERQDALLNPREYRVD